MRKKGFCLLLLLLVCCAGGVFFYMRMQQKATTQPIACAFCDPQIVNRQKFYEDDQVVALCTHKPIVPSHFLIIPKRHIERLEMLSEEETLALHRVMDLVNRASTEVFQTSSYLVHQKNGLEVGQSVPHVHFHLIAKPTGDDSALKFLAKMLMAHLPQ